MTRRLNIVHTESSLGWGGQEIRVLEEALGMMQRGHEVHLICPAESRIYTAAQQRNLPVTSLPVARKNLKGVLALRRWMQQHPEVDIFNTHSSTDSWLVALASRFVAHPAAIVRTRHISAPVPDNLPSRWLYQSVARHIVTTGERLKQQLIQDNGFAPQSLTSVPTGIRLERFVPGIRAGARQSLGLPIDVPVIGIVATLRSWKGHRYLMEAFTALPDTNSRLVIVGDGPQRDALEALAKAAGIHERVTFAGNQQDVVPWMQAMDIFALPSYANEGVPQALMQAMLCGLPVISTPVGSITEIVQDGVTGLIIPPEDASALRMALQSLLDNPAQRESLGQAARDFGVRTFGLDAMLDRMEAIFQDAAARV